MPNRPHRMADFIAKHGGMEREHEIVTGSVPSAGKRWPCPGCEASVPLGTRCSPCAAALVEEWKAGKA